MEGICSVLVYSGVLSSVWRREGGTEGKTNLFGAESSRMPGHSDTRMIFYRRRTRTSPCSVFALDREQGQVGSGPVEGALKEEVEIIFMTACN